MVTTIVTTLNMQMPAFIADTKIKQQEVLQMVIKESENITSV